MSLCPIDITRLLVSSFKILSPTFNSANYSCCLFMGVSAFTLLFSWGNSRSIEFKSGDWLGQCKTFHFIAFINSLTGCFGFWVIVLMQYEALPHESGDIFVNIGRKDGFVLEIDRYIGLPIFFPIFKHFTIIEYRFCKKKKYIIFIFILFVTYIII